MHDASTRWKFVVSALKDSLLQKLWAVCKAGVQSLAQDAHEVQEGSFLHSVAIWVKHQILTISLDIERYTKSLCKNMLTTRLISQTLSCVSVSGF